MSIEVGTRLGSFEVASLIGKGRMGEVWKAWDTSSGRYVAIKLLPEEFARDERRLGEFVRKVRALTSVTHPNIAAIHALEESEGNRFLVLELVEGDTLADRLKKGPISVEESLSLALQIAEALEAAHEKGVLHLDLKPANVKVAPDGRVKILDLGFAKPFAAEATDPKDDATSATTSLQQGVILGTPAYLSPERIRGASADERADVWSFGVLLFELLTGRPMFTGTSAAHVLADILRSEPDWQRLPSDLPPQIRLLLERCLERNVGDRYHGVSDARLDIEGALGDLRGGGPPPPGQVVEPKSYSKLLWVGAAVIGIVTGVVAWNLRPIDPAPITRFDYPVPDESRFRSQNRSVLAVSPDGGRFVYNGRGGLHLRSMDNPETRLIPGTERALTTPVFSPDGEWIAYFQDGYLKRISVDGGAPVLLATVGPRTFEMSWGVTDTILWAESGVGILEVPATGGEPSPLIAIGEGEEVSRPQLLPGGEWVLFSLTRTTGPDRWDEAHIVVQSLESGAREVLVAGGSDARYVPTGHLVYALGDSLFARAFDLDSREVGQAVRILEGVQRAILPHVSTGAANFGVSENGTLIFVPAVSDEATVLATVDRDGVVERLDLPAGQYRHPRISPDGQRAAFEIIGDDGRSSISVALFEGGVMRRLTIDADSSSTRPLWTPDGQRVVFSSDRDGPASIYWQDADGRGVAERLTFAEEGRAHYPESWSPDGRVLSFAVTTLPASGKTWGLWTLALDTGEPPQLLYDLDSSNQLGSAFSPDGRWVAYASGEDSPYPGDISIYVEPFPRTGVRYEVTNDAAIWPVWSANGDELFFRRPGGSDEDGPSLMRAEIKAEGSDLLFFGPPAPVTDGLVSNQNYRDYDVAPDGERILAVVPALDDAGGGVAASLRISVVLNWSNELRERVPPLR